VSGHGNQVAPNDGDDNQHKEVQQGDADKPQR
jgi:hypothetical protein